MGNPVWNPRIRFGGQWNSVYQQGFGVVMGHLGTKYLAATAYHLQYSKQFEHLNKTIIAQLRLYMVEHRSV